MACRFTVDGRRIVATAEQVEAALWGIPPDPIRVYAVEVRGKLYPVTQALSLACRLERGRCYPQVACRVLRQLGFTVSAVKPPPRGRGTVTRLRKAHLPRSPEIGPIEDQFLELPPIHLPWSRWERWEHVAEYGAAILDLPLDESGVYEVRLEGSEERLTIGRATNLRQRILHGLIRGGSPHEAGRKIRDQEDVRQVVVRWAVTDRPAAAEEELHRRHLATFGHLPKYTLRT
jgi:hypothetical protein